MLAATIVMAVATAILVFFTAATWKILITQHKLYNDPELKIHPWPEADIATTVNGLAIVGLAATDEEKRSRAQYVEYRVALVNPGSVPITVTAVKENAITGDGGQQQLSMRFSPPPQARPAGLFMSDLPSFIPARDFAICSRWLSFSGENEGLENEDFRLRVTWRYDNGRRCRTITQDPPLRWGYDEAYPGQRAARA